MDTLDIRNLQLSYQAIYDEVLCESMEDLGIIGEARDGYGDDSKFNKPDDKIEKPGTTVPKPKKGGHGRISRSTPYGIGAHANRTASRVTTIVGEDPGAPRAEKMAKETKKKGPKRVIPSRFDKADFELWINSLLDEGYDLSNYTLDEMYNLYERENSPYEQASDAALDARYGYGRAKGNKHSFGRAANRSSAAAALLALRRGERSGSGTSREAGANAVHQGWARTARTSTDQTPEKKERRATLANTPYSRLPNDEQEKDRVSFDAVKAVYNNRNNTRKESLDYYDIILEYLIYEGYADTVENAEAIMVNMSEEWVDDIIK